MIYYAYCTLLAVDEMHKYCPTARPLGVGCLRGYRLTFATHHRDTVSGGCNLDPAGDAELLGVMYEVTREEMDRLSAASGVDKGFYKPIEVTVSDESGSAVRAITYVIPEPGGAFRPTAAYVRPILAGARAWSLPAEYIANLERTVTAAQQA
jgi:cation transport regulator ChaC